MPKDGLDLVAHNAAHAIAELADYTGGASFEEKRTALIGAMRANGEFSLLTEFLSWFDDFDIEGERPE